MTGASPASRLEKDKLPLPFTTSVASYNNAVTLSLAGKSTSNEP